MKNFEDFDPRKNSIDKIGPDKGQNQKAAGFVLGGSNSRIV
jgi:hypothetical protein